MMRNNLAWVLSAGGILGAIALILVELGNPANMGFCLACFDRDIAGALGLFDWAAGPKYLRPEIIGITLGSLATAVMFREFKPKGGSSPALRFMLGLFMMLGALVFLGCPTRMVLRLGGGDLNAVIALFGFIGGIWAGVYFLRRGYNLGRTQATGLLDGFVFPGFMVLLLLFLVFQVKFSEGGPILASPSGHLGGEGSPVGLGIGIAISLAAGLLVGYLGQRSRLCFAGGFRDMIIMRSPHLLWGIVALFVVVVIGNLVLGNFHLGFMIKNAAGEAVSQPISNWDPANPIWSIAANFAGMALVGLCATLLGGCPFRQLILAGNGNTDSAVTVLGMIAGAAFVHNFGLAKAATPYGKAALALGLALVLMVGWRNRSK